MLRRWPPRSAPRSLSRRWRPQRHRCVARLAASSLARIASSLSQRVIATLVPLLRSARRYAPSYPSSCSMPTKPLVATVSPSMTTRAASSADMTLLRLMASSPPERFLHTRRRCRFPGRFFACPSGPKECRVLPDPPRRAGALPPGSRGCLPGTSPRPG
jgi:hypothetical protein